MRMANIGALLKDEIARLSRKEVRRQVESMRKASAQYRRHIATLKREVSTLQREVARLSGRFQKGGAAPVEPATTTARFAPKGLKTHRLRLGLSANDYGKLAGVSAQSVYNWEQGIAKPRAGQRATLAALRSVGKRQATARLQQLNGAGRGK
jgi:DNA-binding XRE family transcriptional regulator